MKRILCFLVATLLLVNVDFAFAQDEKEDVFHLGKIVITPSRLYQEYGQVSRATNLITEEEIQDKNPITVNYLLDDLPSALVQDTGTLGQSSTIRFRGAESSQSLVLVDNILLNNQRDGTVNLSNYTTENIEKIEVVRGPSSSLYGAGAVGGTVNIITKEGKTPMPETTISSRFGTFRTHVHEITNGAKLNDFNYFLSASSANTEGNRKNSAYKAETYYSKIGYDFGDNHKIRLSGRYYTDELGTPGKITAPDEDDKLEDRQNYLNAAWESDFNNKLNLKIQGYMALNRLEFTETVFPGLDKFTHQTKDHAINAQGTYTIFKDYTIMAGVEGKKYLLNSSSSGKHDYISRSAYGLLDLHFFDILDVTPGARVDDFSTTGTQVSPSVNGALHIKNWKIRGLFAQSYRVPTFNDLYWPDDGWAKGNPNLVPEKGRTFEVGIDNIADLLMIKKIPLDTKLGVTYFHTDMKNLINWAEDAADTNSFGFNYWKPRNVAKSRIEGIELEGEAVIMKDISAEFNYTLTKGKDKDTKRYLPNRPKHKFDFSASYKHPLGIIGRFHSQYVSKAYSDPNNNVQIKPYWVFGTDLYYDVDKHIRYFINIDNMFNRTYEKSKDYPMPGFSIMSGLRVDF